MFLVKLRPDLTGTGVSRRRARWVATIVFWTLVLLVLVFVVGPDTFTHDATGSSASRRPTPASATKSSRPTVGVTMPRSAPTRLKISKIGVNAPFTPLAIGPSGALGAPPANDTNLVGWHAAGISPGERGTALIAGHLDTVTAPAVFARLNELTAGDSFEVMRADGTTAVFVVDSVESFSKDDFPNRRVYDDTPKALARLITCSGAYDGAAKDYTENLVVFAHLAKKA
ncbi:class F sortase [Streptomyces sp. NPDC005568]|uniref:class F sortase n=1 Tax=Streptomyces sp. NPDC005568 TaxID=3156887 RepID=UPI0033A02EFB